MITANKAREIANRAQFNLYDDQLRTIFELIEDSAKKGEYSFSFTTSNYGDLGLDYNFWFESVKENNDSWQKINKVLKDNGFTVSFVINTIADRTITIFW